jgi:hypothetical protein
MGMRRPSRSGGKVSRTLVAMILFSVLISFWLRGYVLSESCLFGGKGQ